jgi:hypothetical protein
MPFALRPYRRFPVDLPMTYKPVFRDGRGAVLNVSQQGWRLSGDLRLEGGDISSFKVILPIRKHLSVAAGLVRWVRGQD